MTEFLHCVAFQVHSVVFSCCENRHTSKAESHVYNTKTACMHHARKADQTEEREVAEVTKNQRMNIVKTIKLAETQETKDILEAADDNFNHAVGCEYSDLVSSRELPHKKTVFLRVNSFMRSKNSVYHLCCSTHDVVLFWKNMKCFTCFQSFCFLQYSFYAFGVCIFLLLGTKIEIVALSNETMQVAVLSDIAEEKAM